MKGLQFGCWREDSSSGVEGGGVAVTWFEGDRIGVWRVKIHVEVD